MITALHRALDISAGFGTVEFGRQHIFETLRAREMHLVTAILGYFLL